MSDSVRPHRRQPTRLPCPRDSLGKNTGVGCHFVFQSMKVKSESEVAQSCPTLLDPMDCSPSGSSIHGIFQARVLEWGSIAIQSGFDSAVELSECFSFLNSLNQLSKEEGEKKRIMLRRRREKDIEEMRVPETLSFTIFFY